jgi:hypothetical protein
VIAKKKLVVYEETDNEPAKKEDEDRGDRYMLVMARHNLLVSVP